MESWTTKPVLVIHGGAGTILRKRFPPERQAEFKNALLASLQAGMAVLSSGGSALSAVEAAVMSMEDCPLFNCGKGSVFTIGGKNEMEACIADGRTGMAGSATLIHRVRNPISLAREEFAAKQKLPLVKPNYFWTPLRWRQHVEDHDKELNSSQQSVNGKTAIDYSNEINIIDSNDDADDDFVVVDWNKNGRADYEAAPQGTVGAVALDGLGNIAAATSTGGRNNKWDGRIGDTPILGAGSYAPIGNQCGISCTGNGEYFIKYAVGHDVFARMKYCNENIQVAAKTVVDELFKVDGAGGLIAIDSEGNCNYYAFNTPGMYRGYARHGEEPQAFIFPEDEQTG
ncbi:nucleophile aminohydrolase [Syncephalis fuscata]|nr:nucleophile aminohydrolase [Syncephalis fuscata]